MVVVGGTGGTHLLANRTEDTSRHAAEAVKHLEESNDGQDGGDELDHLCRITKTAISAVLKRSE